MLSFLLPPVNQEAISVRHAEYHVDYQDTLLLEPDPVYAVAMENGRDPTTLDVKVLLLSVKVQSALVFAIFTNPLTIDAIKNNKKIYT